MSEFDSSEASLKTEKTDQNSETQSVEKISELSGEKPVNLNENELWARVQFLESRLKDSEQNLSNRIKEINLFRTLGLSLDPTSEVPSVSHVSLRAQWEKLEPEKLFEWLGFIEWAYNTFAEITYKLKNQKELKKALEKKTKEQLESVKQSLDDAKTEKYKKSQFYKMTQHYVKTMKMNENDAKRIVRQLGIIEPSETE